MRKALLFTLGLALTLQTGCGQKPAEEAEGEILARIGSTTITQADFDRELEQVPPFQRREMEGPEGKKKFLDRLVEMELLYQAALADGMEDDPEFQDEVERARRQILMRHYYRDQIEAKAEPAEEEISAYYAEHQAEFEVKERMRGRMIMADSRQASEALAARVRAGEDFAALARSASSDPVTAKEDGDLGWFTRDGYVRSIGVDKDFTALVFNLDAGQMSDPIEVEGKGWVLIKVEEKEEQRTKELGEVRDDIARRLTPKAREDYYRASVEKLKQRFNAEIFAEAVPPASPEELFELAQNTKDPEQRIGYYKQMVERFSDAPEADRAAFMIGFVYSEELQDKEKAREAFLSFMERYPDSDLVKDANYMLDALDGHEPPFEIGGEDSAAKDAP